MQVENKVSSYLDWKTLGGRVFVSQFDSHAKNSHYGQIKIYSKFFQSQINQPGKTKTLFLFHDLGQHHGRFKNFIEAIGSMNLPYNIVCMDFVGHGLSSGTRGHFEKFDQLSDDVLKLLTSFKHKDNEQEEWILLGHGLGGIVLLDLMGRYPHVVNSLVDKIVLSNFILRFPFSLKQIQESLNFNKTSLLQNIFSSVRPLRLYKSHQMLQEPRDMLDLEQDPLCIHRPTIKSLVEIQNKLETIYQDSYFLDKPLMVMHSEADPLISRSGTQYFLRGVKKELLHEKSYSFMKHDLYNEKDRELIFNDIIQWLETC